MTGVESKVRLSCVELCAALVLVSIGPVQLCAAAQTDALTIRSDEAARPLLDRAETLLGQGDAQAAYTMLSADEQRYAGDAWFDYLLGVAALDTGRHGEAVFSLRRALDVEPAFAGARMELARAHYEAGNSALARPLFLELLDDDPPAAVRDVIQGYIDAIDGRRPAPAGGFRTFVEIAAGHDTNANGSTADEEFLGFTLSPENVETESPYWRLAAGFNASFPQSERLAWYVGGQAYHRGNPDASFVDSTAISGQGGFAFRSGRFFGRVGADAWRTWRDGEDNQAWGGADLLLGRNVGDAWEISFGLRAGSLDHDDAIEVLDVDRVLYTLGFSYRFARETQLTLSLIGGNDSERESGSPYGNDRSGATLGLSTPLGSGVSPAYLFLSVGSLTTDYDGQFFGASREDEQTSASAQIEFRDVGIDGLSVVPQLRYVDNDSDVDLYAYDRSEIGVAVRWVPR